MMMNQRRMGEAMTGVGAQNIIFTHDWSKMEFVTFTKPVTTDPCLPLPTKIL